MQNATTRLRLLILLFNGYMTVGFDPSGVMTKARLAAKKGCLTELRIEKGWLNGFWEACRKGDRLGRELGGRGAWYYELSKVVRKRSVRYCGGCDASMLHATALTRQNTTVSSLTCTELGFRKPPSALRTRPMHTTLDGSSKPRSTISVNANQWSQ